MYLLVYLVYGGGCFVLCYIVSLLSDVGYLVVYLRMYVCM